MRNIFSLYKTHRRLMRLLVSRPRMFASLARIAAGPRLCAQRYYDKGACVAAPPVAITIRITNRCNQRCIQCGQWGEAGVFKRAGSSVFSPELTTRQIKDFIDQVAGFRPLISFFGGEPLLREDICELVAYADSKDLLTEIFSNATLLEPKAQALVKAGLTFYRTSLDGPEPVNDKIRKGRDSFKAAVAGLRRLVSLRDSFRAPTPVIQINTTITKENQHVLFDTALIAEALKADVFSVLFGIFTTEELFARSNEKFRRAFNVDWGYWRGFILDRSGMDIAAIQKQIAAIKKRQWRFVYRQEPQDSDQFDIGRHFNRPDLFHGKGLCILPWSRMHVLPNGDTALCEDFPDYITGNILQQGPLDIWNGERYKKFRQYILDHGVFPVCSRCCGIDEVPYQ